MFHPSSLQRGALVGLLAATTAALVLVPAAHGAVPGACDDQVIEHPFMPWADPAGYVLVPNGTVERRGSWKLEGGAARVKGNESFHVHGDLHATSLWLPPGSSATTAPMCVGLEHPTLRLFARNGGSPLSTLLVEVLFEDADGRSRALPIGAHLGAASWQPTAPLAVVANLFAALPGEHIDIAFRFTPQGAGDWSIDDVNVDPFRHG